MQCRDIRGHVSSSRSEVHQRRSTNLKRFSILVLFAQENLGLTGTGYGLLLAFCAIGGLLGAFLALRLRRRLGYRRTIGSSLLLGHGCGARV